MAHGDVLWTPPPDVRAHSGIGRYLRWLEAERGLAFDGYRDLWQWSIDDLPGFWGSVWDHFGLGPPVAPERVLTERAMPGATWFPDVRLSYADLALRGDAERAAVVSVSQTRDDVELTTEELREQVARARAGLQRLGVGPGDRVVAYLPNVAETLVAFLATASLGAIWASCAPEFGTSSVVARFQQIDPKVLLAIDGYRYGAKVVERHREVAEIQAALPGLQATVLLPYLDGAASWPGTVPWAELVAEPGPLAFEPVPFDHPLYTLYSSGTTGLPKPIVHGHGGIALEHVKALALQKDIGPDDRFFWFSTTGWMMWNFLVSGLLVGATIVCFDGDPAWPDLMATWRLAADQRVTSFGTSAPFLMACRKAGLAPGTDLDLSALRAVGSTGAPLPAAGFEWVYEAVRDDVFLSSISGGTDVCSAFVGGSALLPVRSGVIAAPCLGVHVEALSPSGEPLVGEQGELVISAPMPSMPVGFWGDDGRRYRAAYFERFPGRWHHGDWITIEEDGASVITGRSDATLNRGGVRLGTSDFYTVVEAFDEVADSLVVHLEDDEGGSGRLLLFVLLAPGASLDDDLRARLATALRTQLSPRHVPDDIVAVTAVPRTLSGKKLEVPVKRILLGQPPDAVASEDALADPRALDPYKEMRG